MLERGDIVVYIGLSARILINLEALNMAESIGNVVRHKRAPIVVRVIEEGMVKYVLKYAPVISGQSIAHGYQRMLAEIGEKMGLPVCPLCKQGVFVKHSSDEIIKDIANKYKTPYTEKLLNAFKKKGVDGIHEFEKTLIENCIVEDVGGFLYTGKTPVKRTSRFQSGYMIPAIDAHEAVASEALFHVRHDPTAEAGRQSIYYVETGSALYTVNMALDVDGVGRTSAVRIEDLPDRKKRVEASVRALATLIANMGWGAKKTRFLPHWDIESIVVTVSHPLPFNPKPGHSPDYISETIRVAESYQKALKKIDEESYVKIYYYAKTGVLPEKLFGAGEPNTPLDAVLATLEQIKETGA